ncbi:hypothetical protein [Aliivibrio sp. S2MY1]|uniref:hypothetical protein n=1 Tax=Aliivibrio sp. S2MY1 TaxID=3028423 RepID=UPI0023785AD8|nr:hypothetical protein [Aliivibrio sp. S2MY1]MDD9200789.1 hypothetical protein [Aliivibrio sp. S2MY1]
MVCKLCGGKDPLQKSHIIPKSYLRGLKQGNGQLVSIVCDDESPPKKVNSDPKEKLLCRNCEQFISDNYEKYGTRLFKSSQGVKKARRYVELNGFKYTEYYLFLISILWRASVSTLTTFSNIELTERVEDALASCIRNKSIKINTSLKLDHFVRISVLRVIDTKCGVDDDVIQSAFLHLGVEAGKTPKEGLIYYFMINGFLICYHFGTETDLHTIRTKRLAGQLLNRSQIRIPKVEISDLKQVHDAFDNAYNKSKSHAIK